MMRYKLAPQGVFSTIQGEGPLIGLPMVFIRLAGCSVGCPLCDTDYRAVETVDAAEIIRRADSFKPRWAWITGGEPADYHLEDLVRGFRNEGFSVAIATSGIRSLGVAGMLADHVSVSPHRTPKELAITSGDNINLVPGLNGLRLADWESFDARGFRNKFVTPVWSHQSDRAEGVTECVDFVRRHEGWRLGVQAHKSWRLA